MTLKQLNFIKNSHNIDDITVSQFYVLVILLIRVCATTPLYIAVCKNLVTMYNGEGPITHNQSFLQKNF